MRRYEWAAAGVAYAPTRWHRASASADADVKRIMDIVLTVALLPIALPVVLLCALAVKLESRGPAFVAQRCRGLGGRSFTLWRLRTTSVETATTGPEPTGSVLPGLAPMHPARLSRFLRSTHLDGSPQLLNVWRGDMSLVGPPTSSTSTALPLWYTGRLEVRPGMTGLAQISAGTVVDSDQTVRLDIAYIRSRTIALDLAILLRSIAVIANDFADSWRRAAPVADARVAPLASPVIPLPQLAARALVIADVAAVSAALAIAYALRFVLDFGVHNAVVAPPAVEYLKLSVLLGATTAITTSFLQLYRADCPHSTLEETVAVAKAATFATVIALAIAFFYRDFNYSRLTLGYFWALAVLLVASTHAMFRKWVIGRYARGLDLTPALVVGSPSAHLLHRLRNEPAFGLDVIGWLGPLDALEQKDSGAGVLLSSAKSSREQPVTAALPRLGHIADAARVIAHMRVQRVIVIEYGLSHAQLLETLDACERFRADVQLIPPIYDLLIDPTDLAIVNGVPTLRIDEARSRRVQRTIKRAFDVCASLALLMLIAPVLIAIAIAIRYTSPGPVFFRQIRAGRNGQPFEMVKFRTMVCDAEQRLTGIIDIDRLAQPVFKIANDPRVTPIGRWLRRFSLDELPQLLNVLKGDMTLVGPRPEELKIVQRYDVWQRRRLKMKPGITGLQQVVARGALSDLTERVQLDMYYTRKQSFLLDMVILGRTVGVVLSGRGAT